MNHHHLLCLYRDSGNNTAMGSIVLSTLHNKFELQSTIIATLQLIICTPISSIAERNYILNKHLH